MATVLVVEDDPDIGKLIMILLDFAGLSGVLRTDGASGLTAITDLQPDVLVLDVGLPVLDGWEVLKRIRTADGPRLPVLLLSAHAQETDRNRGLRMGADAFMLKPFRNDELVARLHDLLPTADSSTTGAR